MVISRTSWYKVLKSTLIPSISRQMSKYTGEVLLCCVHGSSVRWFIITDNFTGSTLLRNSVQALNSSRFNRVISKRAVVVSNRSGSGVIRTARGRAVLLTSEDSHTGLEHVLSKRIALVRKFRPITRICENIRPFMMESLNRVDVIISMGDFINRDGGIGMELGGLRHIIIYVSTTTEGDR